MFKLIYGGFDPSFVDINIRPQKDSKSELIEELPVLGSHHTKTAIDFIPGGNGFNFCRTLSSFGEDVTYVGPSDSFFQSLVQKLNLKLEVYPIKNAQVNYTAILNMKPGEIQFNNVRGALFPSLLSAKILEFYKNSPIKQVSNIALNENSIEWISSLLASLHELDNSLLFDNNVTYKEKFSLFDELTFDGILIIDPSDISNYERLNEFYQLLLSLDKFRGEKILSVNEHEMATLCGIEDITPKELFQRIDFPVLFHTSEYVKYICDKELYLEVKKLNNYKTFVGAGDVFNASVVYALLRRYSIEDSIKFGIKGASHLIQTGNYPTF